MVDESVVKTIWKAACRGVASTVGRVGNGRFQLSVPFSVYVNSLVYIYDKINYLKNLLFSQKPFTENTVCKIFAGSHEKSGKEILKPHTEIRKNGKTELRLPDVICDD